MTGLKLLACTEAPQVIPPLKGEGRRALARRGGVPPGRSLSLASTLPSFAGEGWSALHCSGFCVEQTRERPEHQQDSGTGRVGVR
jgi:hypothetical protein